MCAPGRMATVDAHEPRMIEPVDAWLGTDALVRALGGGDLTVEGRLAGASNAAVRCFVEVAPGIEVRCVYKPVRGERPLWDFPDGTLCGREVAAFEMCTALGWSIVPPTVWREDGPAGPGMCQAWIDIEPGRSVVDVLDPAEIADGWLRVFEGFDGSGQPVVLVHQDSAPVQRVALLDAVINNADRKGGHLLCDASGRLWGIDHGVAFSDEDKLRTVLWGWAGQPIPDDLLGALDAAEQHPAFERALTWLLEEEVRALRARIHRLKEEGRFPIPAGDWPAIPWPVF